jgi:NhaP-type Na+/H+ or K+/H+ antiporter
LEHAHHTFLYLALIPVIGVAAQWLAWRSKLPSILLLLAGGLGLRQIMFALGQHDAPISEDLLFPLVSLAVAIVLFEGGLSLRLSELREAGGVVFRLCTFGALITWILTAISAWLIFGVNPRLAALIGAILVVTGPTVVAPLLRHIRPVRRIGSVVKWEGIVIDPIGAVFAVLVFEFVVASSMGDAMLSTLIALMNTILIGTIVGVLAAILLMLLLRYYLVPDFLHSPVVLGTVIGAFALSDVFQSESGLLTVTVAGLVLANQKLVPVKHVMEFKENLQVLLISALFVVLGSRINPMDLQNLGALGGIFLLSLVLVIRPASVMLATIRSELNLRERIFLSFLAPRGIVAAAVASVFAIKLSGVSDKLPEVLQRQLVILEPLTFFVIVGTVAIYGLLAVPLARKLKLAATDPQGLLIAGAAEWIRELASVLQNEGIHVLIVDTNFGNVSAARQSGIAAHCASIVGEYVHEEVDMNNLGNLLAMTPNDEVNSLAIQEFVGQFGSAHVYQLAPQQKGSRSRDNMSEHLMGRILFGDSFTYATLQQRLKTSSVKRTKLSKEFGYEQFKEHYGDQALVLFALNESGRLQIATSAERFEPLPGWTLIAVVPKDVSDSDSLRRRSTDTPLPAPGTSQE